MHARLAKLNEEQEKLRRKVNPKVMGHIEKAEQEFQDLVRKRDQIEKDKSKIEQVIAVRAALLTEAGPGERGGCVLNHMRTYEPARRRSWTARRTRRCRRRG